MATTVSSFTAASSPCGRPMGYTEGNVGGSGHQYAVIPATVVADGTGLSRIESVLNASTAGIPQPTCTFTDVASDLVTKRHSLL